MAKFRVRYRRGASDREFETEIEVNAYTRNQAMIKISENKGDYKDSSTSMMSRYWMCRR